MLPIFCQSLTQSASQADAEETLPITQHSLALLNTYCIGCFAAKDNDKDTHKDKYKQKYRKTLKKNILTQQHRLAALLQFNSQSLEDTQVGYISKNTLLINILSENTLSENIPLENTLLENTLSENTLSENTLDKNTLLESTLLEHTHTHCILVK